MGINRETTPYNIREGDYLAVVDVPDCEDGRELAPRVPVPDLSKLDVVRDAIRRGDLAGACKLALLYEMVPVAFDLEQQ